MIQDLTEGRPLKLLFFFSLPMILGNLFQQLYNLVDSVVVGNFVGPDALAAVGASFPVVFLAIALASGLSMGCNVVISQLFGARQIRRMKSTVTTALISLLIMGAAITLAGELAAPTALRLLNTPSDILDDSLLYLRIYFAGTLFLFLYNTLNGIFTALGDSRTPLRFLIFSALLNIALDLLFVIRFRMGVGGVAWATLISQTVCALLSALVLYRRLHRLPDGETEEADGKRPLFVPEAIREIAQIGIPSMIQQSIVSVSMLLIQGVVNSFGSSFVAGYTAATKIDNLALLPNLSFSGAISSYTAQNMGAGKTDRVRKGYHSCLLLAGSCSLIITGLIFLFGPSMLELFMDAKSNPETIGYGMDYMRSVSAFYFLMGFMFVTNGLLRGAGDMKAFMTSSLFNLSTRVILAYTLAARIGSSVIWWSIPVGWVIGSVIAFSRYQSGVWTRKKVIRNSGHSEK